MSPLVRNFLNKDHDLAIDYALKSCKELQPQIDPLVSGLLVYTVNGPQSSRMLYPESVTSIEIQTAVTAIQKVQSVIYQNILQKCMTESEHAINYYTGLSKSEMTNSAIASGYDSKQIEVMTGALDLSKKLALFVPASGYKLNKNEIKPIYVEYIRSMQYLIAKYPDIPIPNYRRNVKWWLSNFLRSNLLFSLNLK